MIKNPTYFDHAVTDYSGPVKTAPSGPLTEAIGRIKAATRDTRELAGQMGNIADTVFGPVPETCGADTPSLAHHSGLIGELLGSINLLETAQLELRGQCNRAMVLA